MAGEPTAAVGVFGGGRLFSLPPPPPGGVVANPAAPPTPVVVRLAGARAADPCPLRRPVLPRTPGATAGRGGRRGCCRPRWRHGRRHPGAALLDPGRVAVVPVAGLGRGEHDAVPR